MSNPRVVQAIGISALVVIVSGLAFAALQAVRERSKRAEALADENQRLKDALYAAESQAARLYSAMHPTNAALAQPKPRGVLSARALINFSGTRLEDFRRLLVLSVYNESPDFVPQCSLRVFFFDERGAYIGSELVNLKNLKPGGGVQYTTPTLDVSFGSIHSFSGRVEQAEIELSPGNRRRAEFDFHVTDPKVDWVPRTDHRVLRERAKSLVVPFDVGESEGERALNRLRALEGRAGK